MDSNAIFVYGFNKAYSSINLLFVLCLYLTVIISYLIFNKNNRISLSLYVLLLAYHTIISIIVYYNVWVADSILYYNMAASDKFVLYNIIEHYDIAFIYALLSLLIHKLNLTFLSCTLIFNLFRILCAS